MVLFWRQRPIEGDDEAWARDYRAEGFDIIAYGPDVTLLRSSLAKDLAGLRTRGDLVAAAGCLRRCAPGGTIPNMEIVGHIRRSGPVSKLGARAGVACKSPVFSVVAGRASLPSAACKSPVFAGGAGRR